MLKKLENCEDFKLEEPCIHTNCSRCNASLAVYSEGKAFDANNEEMWDLLKRSEYDVLIKGLRKGYRALSHRQKAEAGITSEKKYLADQLKTEMEGFNFVACPKCKHVVLFYLASKT
jgi:hypothetical protein